MDYSEYTDGDLRQLAAVVNAERVKRATLAESPRRLEDVIVEYVAQGGNAADLLQHAADFVAGL